MASHLGRKTALAVRKQLPATASHCKSFCGERNEKERKEKKNARLTLWLSPLFLILLASLPVDRTNRDTSSSAAEPGMVPILSVSHSTSAFQITPPLSSPLEEKKKSQNLRPLLWQVPLPPQTSVMLTFRAEAITLLCSWAARNETSPPLSLPSRTCLSIRLGGGGGRVREGRGEQRG